MAKLGKSVPVQFRKEGVWTPQLGMYLLWFMYLQVSQSYELARCFRGGLLSNADRDKLPSDLDFVLALYDNLGDVWNPEFVDWWQDRGIDNFGYHGGKPTVRHIATLQRNRQTKHAFFEDAATYIDGQWQNEGHQNTLILAIPATLSKAKILKKVGQFVDSMDADQKRLKAPPPRYRLHGKKHDEASLLRYLEVLKCRALNPKMPLWEIGVVTNLSSQYSQQFKDGFKGSAEKLAEAKNALKILTSRALLRGRMIAENAARGIFPSYALLPQTDRDRMSKCFNEDRMRALVLRRKKALQARGSG